MGIQQFLYAKYIKPLARGAALFGLTLGLAGCAQSNAADAADHTVSETETAKESSANGPVLNPYEGPRWLTTPEVDPQARKAVEIAVKAYQDKKWDKVGEQIEAAQEDPVLGHYPEYWWLMRQPELKLLPVREAALQRYIAPHADTYLAERLKGDWAVAAARVGDFQSILDLDPPTFGCSDVFCAQAHAMHMGGLSLDRDAVMREFRPNEVCWGLMDQLWADDALSWSQLQL